MIIPCRWFRSVTRSPEAVRGPRDGTAHPVVEKSRRRFPRTVRMA